MWFAALPSYHGLRGVSVTVNNSFFLFVVFFSQLLTGINLQSYNFFLQVYTYGEYRCYVITEKTASGWFVIYNLFAGKDIWLSVGRLHDMGDFSIFFLFSFPLFTLVIFFFFYVVSLSATCVFLHFITIVYLAVFTWLQRG